MSNNPANVDPPPVKAPSAGTARRPPSEETRSPAERALPPPGDAPPTQAGTSSGARCPHCQVAIPFLVEDSLAGVQCAMCGEHFSLAGCEETLDRNVPARIVGDFKLLEKRGKGRFGIVWKAWDMELDRVVAVKLPREEYRDSAQIESFKREARAAAQVKHPCIVGVHKVETDGDQVFIVSDFIDGLNLGDWLKTHRPTVDEAAALCLKLAEALHAAHEAGVIHRDLKPTNILIDAAGEPHVTDFGVARREVGEETLTVAGQVLGTLEYMPPEQARGESHLADRRSDVYSLGVILYELLTGEPPFRGTPQMLLRRVEYEEPRAPRALNHCVPPDLETVCLKCLEKDPRRRYATAGDLADELRRYLRGEPVRVRPVGTLGRIWRWYCRHPSAAIWAAGGYATCCAVLLLLWGAGGLAMFCLPQFQETPGLNTLKLHILLFAVFYYCPMLWAGVQSLNGRAVGLWLGLALALVGMIFSLIGASGSAFPDEIYGADHLRSPLFILLFLAALIGAVLHLLGIVSYLRAERRRE